MNNEIKIGQNYIANNIRSNPRYRIEILTKEYIDQVVEVFTYAFCRSEPMTSYLQLDEQKYKIFARAVTEQAVLDKLSVIALDGEKVVACALTEDLASPGPIPDFDPKFVYILALLEKLGEGFLSAKTLAKGNVGHLFITAVNHHYRNQGLSTQVNFHAMDLASQKGFMFMYCELTHPYNESGILHHLKNPKWLIGDIIYSEFKIGDYHPFKNLPGGARSYLWTIKQNAKLKYLDKETSNQYIEV